MTVTLTGVGRRFRRNSALRGLFLLGPGGVVTLSGRTGQAKTALSHIVVGPPAAEEGNVTVLATRPAPARRHASRSWSGQAALRLVPCGGGARARPGNPALGASLATTRLASLEIPVHRKEVGRRAGSGRGCR
jgi:hypothetical protein